MELTEKDRLISGEMRRVVAEIDSPECWEFRPVLTPASEVWLRAHRWSSKYAARFVKHWTAIQDSGSWGDTGWMLGAALLSGFSVVKIYTWTLLYSCKFVNPFDVTGDCARLAAYCGA